MKQPSPAIRIERDRPSDLPLVQLCLQKPKPPTHISEVATTGGARVFLVDLPAGVFKTVRVKSDREYSVATYRSRGDRWADL